MFAIKKYKKTDRDDIPGLFHLLNLLHSAVTCEVVSPIWAEDVDDFDSAIIGSDHFAISDIDPDVRDSWFIRAGEENQIALLWRADFCRHIVVARCVCAAHVVASFVQCIGDKSAAVKSGRC